MASSSGVRFRAYPKPEQAMLLSQWIGCQRFVYNAKVQEDRYFRTYRTRSLALTGQPTPVDQQYAQFKNREITPFLYDVPSQVLRNGAYRFMQAYSRFFKKLSGRPAIKKKHGRQTVLLTKELFEFIPTGVTKRTSLGESVKEHLLFIGTHKHPVGFLKFIAHRPYEIPHSLTVSRQNGQWHVSFNYAPVPGLDEPPPLSEEKLIEYFTGLTEEELQTITWGGDRGTVIPLAGSDGVKHHFTPEEKKALEKTHKRRKKLQRKLARQAKGSKRRERTKEKLGRAYTKERTIREDRAHKISRTIVDSPAQVIAFEDLKVSGMVGRPKAKKDESGRFVRNGAKAKAALTRGILDSLWGRIVLFTKYKGLKVNKLTVKVAPHYSSMECSRCGHIHPDNRETQADFLCRECGFAVNADHNAALVIRKRAIQKLLCGEVAVREKKSVVFRRAEQIGQGLPESKRASCAGTAPEHRAGDYHKSH